MTRPLRSIWRYALTLFALLSLGVCLDWPAGMISHLWAAEKPALKLIGKKILWVNSYHKDYPWSAGTEAGLRKALANTGIGLEVMHMDTKRKSSPEAQQAAGLQVSKRVTAMRPDLIIASDDPAQAYAVVPYLLDKSIPIVFTGVNWDAASYGYPRRGVTGMIEIDAFETLVRHLKSLTKGTRFALIGSDDISEQKNIERYLAQNDLFLSQPLIEKIKSYEEFQIKFVELQRSVDVVILLNITTLPGWELAKSSAWVENNTRILTGTLNEWMKDLAVITVSKVPEEQGMYAGKTAIRILQGTAPESIPLVSNEQYRLYLNKGIAERLRIIFPLPLLRASTAPPRAP